MSFLKHYGTPRHSGRYPWGSGKDPQRSADFLQRVSELKKQGLSEVEIAKGFGITTSQLRAKKTIAKAEKRKADFAQALRLKDKGMSNVEIGKRMGMNESSIRSLLDPALQERSDITKRTADTLKKSVASKEYVDVGSGIENYLGVSRTKLNTSISILEEEGYTLHNLYVEQAGNPGHYTTVKVLAKPGVTKSEIYKNLDKVAGPTEYSEDGGRSFLGIEPPRQIDSKRVMIRYAEEGGNDKDGVIELRPGVAELSLGNKHYAQVRIGVDGTHYLKGMAMYGDNFPDGVDIIYNTNKKSGTPKDKVMKSIKDDPDNPFGATIRQRHYVDTDGIKKLSALNIVGSRNTETGEEGAWAEWSKNLSSQMLSKQTPSFAKRQLDLAYDAKREEYDEIMSLTNPTVKRKMLEEFADSCDSASVHLKAAALPRQQTHVILPLTKIKDDEIYAPNYRPGEKVVLIRHPHGGIFEIPQLTVNNKNQQGKKLLGNSSDAVGISKAVADRLSGADFDGDTVIVIPNNEGLIKTSSPLKGLLNFDPKLSYAPYDGMRTIDGGTWNAKTEKVDYGGKRPVTKTKQLKMGDISNLITDMTIKGANTDEIARAVRHSMVVIDSEKHHLDYKRSFIENGIAQLKQKYQGGTNRGASTLISRASSEARPYARKLLTNTAKMTPQQLADFKAGKKVYEYTNAGYTNRKGKFVKRTITSTKMAETSDAFTLSSGTPMETVYANHANKLKALANSARKEALATKPQKYSPSAKQTYATEVASLRASLNIALKNKPLERQAQLLANSIIAEKKASNPDMQPEDLKKIKGQALAEARSRTGAKKQLIEITPRKWEAIQAGAISTNTLMQILNNTDPDTIKKLATPRTTLTMTPAKLSRAKLMQERGYSNAEIADVLGVSTSTLNKALKQ